MDETSNLLFAFRFHWLNSEGAQTSVFAKKGTFDGQTLVLDSAAIPVVLVMQTVVRQQVMVLTTLTGNENEPVAHLIIKPTSQSVTIALKKKIDVARSGVWAKQHRDELAERGLVDRYRDQSCPHCGAITVLTEFPDTPQFYCSYCESLTTTKNPELIKEEKSLKICDECGMYSRPKGFTIFYFYFLLVVYGWWSKTTCRCPACMRGDAWKMLFGNLLFVLGVPMAIVQLCRAYGSDSVAGRFKGLNAANIRARSGDANGAFKLYQSIMERVPSSAGLKYNLANSLVRMKDLQKASQACELALCDCSSYTPAYLLLRGLYTELGELEKLKAIDRVWSNGNVADIEPKPEMPGPGKPDDQVA